MTKYAVAEVTKVLGKKMNKDLKIIEASSEEEAIKIYKSNRPWIERYGIEVNTHEA